MDWQIMRMRKATWSLDLGGATAVSYHHGLTIIHNAATIIQLKLGQLEQSTCIISGRREQYHGTGDCVERALFELVWIKFSYISYVQWKPLSHEHNIFRNYVYCFATNLMWDERLGLDMLSGSAWSCLLKLKVHTTDVFYLLNGIYMGYWYENQKSWIQFFHSLHLVTVLQKGQISLLVRSDATQGGELGLFCLWCEKRMLFPGFPVSPVILFVSVGKIAENGLKMCHVWLQQCERQQGNCFLLYDSCFDITGSLVPGSHLA